MFTRELSPLKTNRNKPIVNLKKRELHYNYESIFNSPTKVRNMTNSRFSSPMRDSMKSTFSSSKGFSDSSNKGYNFTKKIGSDFKLREYSQNNVLLKSKTIKPNDSFDDFVKGKNFFFLFFLFFRI